MNLLDAVERLSATGPMSAITMRAITDEAGCSLGLAYRYYDTKEDLLGAVLDRAAAYITEGFGPDDTPKQMARLAWKRMGERPVFGRLFAWLVLERRDVTDAMSGHPFLRNAAQHAKQEGDPDPTSAAAALGIITIGGGLLAPAINHASDIGPDDHKVYERLARAAQAIQTPPTPRP